MHRRASLLDQQLADRPGVVALRSDRSEHSGHIVGVVEEPELPLKRRAVNVSAVSVVTCVWKQVGDTLNASQTIPRL